MVVVVEEKEEAEKDDAPPPPPPPPPQPAAAGVRRNRAGGKTPKPLQDAAMHARLQKPVDPLKLASTKVPSNVHFPSMVYRGNCSVLSSYCGSGPNVRLRPKCEAPAQM